MFLPQTNCLSQCLRASALLDVATDTTDAVNAFHSHALVAVGAPEFRDLVVQLRDASVRVHWCQIAHSLRNVVLECSEHGSILD